MHRSFANAVPAGPVGGAPRPDRGRTEHSAGGLVLDESRTQAVVIARINRNGRLHWLIPKGHIEVGETPRQAAEREVFEETGIRGLAGAELGQVDYWFRSNHHRVHKNVRHFLMTMRDGELSTADHEVVDVAWFPLRQLIELLRHGDERRIVWRAIELVERPPSLATPASRPRNF